MLGVRSGLGTKHRPACLLANHNESADVRRCKPNEGGRVELKGKVERLDAAMERDISDDPPVYTPRIVITISLPQASVSEEDMALLAKAREWGEEILISQ